MKRLRPGELVRNLAFTTLSRLPLGYPETLEGESFFVGNLKESSLCIVLAILLPGQYAAAENVKVLVPEVLVTDGHIIGWQSQASFVRA